MIASWRPTGPTASPVLALTPDAGPASIASSSAIRWRIGVFVGRELGLLGKHDAIEVHDPIAGRLRPAARRPAASRPNRGRGWPDRCRETSRRCRPGRGARAGRRSPRAAARRHRCARRRALVVRDVDSAQPQRPARHQPMRVVSDSDCVPLAWLDPPASLRAICDCRKCGDYSRMREIRTTRAAGPSCGPTGRSTPA